MTGSLRINSSSRPKRLMKRRAPRDLKAQAALEAAQRQLDVIDTQKRQTQAALDQAMADRDLGAAQSRLDGNPLADRRRGRKPQRACRRLCHRRGHACSPSSRPMASGSMPISRNASLPHIREGQSGRGRRGRAARHHLPWARLSFAPATGAQFSVIPPENATGNFTKVIQRVPVRIAARRQCR